MLAAQIPMYRSFNVLKYAFIVVMVAAPIALPLLLEPLYD